MLSGNIRNKIRCDEAGSGDQKINPCTEAATDLTRRAGKNTGRKPYLYLTISVLFAMMEHVAVNRQKEQT